MSYAVSLLGGEANGAWYEGHALPAPPPPHVDVAIGGPDGPALLDLPEDTLEPGERRVRYVLKSVGHACVRHGKGRGCHAYATYTPEGVDWRNRELRRDMLEAAGVQPPLRLLEGGDGEAG